MTDSYGFFEKLYLGECDLAMLHQDYSASVDEARVSAFMEQYVALIKQYPGAELEKAGSVPDALMKGMADIGLFGLLIESRYGGLDFSISEYLRVVEEMARFDMALVLVPLAHLSIGLKGIILYGSDAQKEKYLSAAASGEMIFGYALTEPKTGSDAQHVEARAEKSPDGSHYILNGTKTYITNANYAGGFTVFAQLDPENKPGYMGAFIVEKNSEGIKVGPDMPKMGLKVSSTASIQFKNVKVPAENLLGTEGEGFKIAMNVLNYGRLSLGAASAGLMSQSVDDMLKRAKSRKQFSVPIGDFELIQEKICAADAHALATKSITYFTAKLLEVDPLMNVAIESSHTKLYGTNRGWDALYDALQTAGGSGFISTQPYEKRMRDARVTTIFEGTTEIHSIYPPLTVFRSWGSMLKNKSKSALSLVLDLPRPRLANPCYDSSLLSEGVKLARRLEREFRRLLSLGLRKYGKGIVTREYFLRSMMRVNLDAFILLATASYIEWKGSGSVSKTDAARYRFLICEAKKTLADSHSRGISDLEQASSELWEYLAAPKK